MKEPPELLSSQAWVVVLVVLSILSRRLPVSCRISLNWR